MAMLYYHLSSLQAKTSVLLIKKNEFDYKSTESTSLTQAEELVPKQKQTK